MARVIKPLEWHRKCCSNVERVLKDKELQLKRIKEEVDRLKVDAAFRKFQIEKAVQAGKSSYDPDTYQIIAFRREWEKGNG